MSEQMIIEILRGRKRPDVGIYAIFEEECIHYLGGEDIEDFEYRDDLNVRNVRIEAVKAIDIKDLLRKYKR